MSELAELGEVCKSLTDEQVKAYKRDRRNRIAAQAVGSGLMSGAATLGANTLVGHPLKSSAKFGAGVAGLVTAAVPITHAPRVIRQNKQLKRAQQGGQR